MNRSVADAGMRAELRVSHGPVLAVLALCGVIIRIGSELVAAASSVRTLSVILVLASSGAWLLEHNNPILARWTTVLASLALALCAAGLNTSALVLLSLPTGLAAALIGIPAAAGIAAAETLIVVLPALAVQPEVDLLTKLFALVGMWASSGLVCAVLNRQYQVLQWSEERFERTRDVVEEARDRRAELSRAMEETGHLNRQLLLVNQRLAALRLVAEDARRAKIAFVARVSHELRTPLNMIIGLVRLMIDAPHKYSVPFPPDLMDDLLVVHRNAEHLLSMINDVLDLTQVEAGRGRLYRQRVDPAIVIETAADAIRPWIESKGLCLKLVIPKDLLQVDCDRTRIRQVVLNLLSNAARFTSSGGITVKVWQNDTRVVVGVTDTGPGIPPDVAERLFEPFYQTGDLWHDQGGSGLGLSICKQFIKLHGGRIWLESEPGIGTTVFFELPKTAPVPLEGQPSGRIRGDWVWQERAFHTEGAGLARERLRPRIVVCDETGDLCAQLARVTDEADFISAPDAARAVDEATVCPAHAVVFNCAMPDSVWPLVERARKRLPDVPLVGVSVPRQAERALQAGAVEYLVKPVTFEDLRRILRGFNIPVRRILLVDDSPDVLRLWRRLVEMYDGSLEVLTAETGEQALEMLRVGHPDIMLLDVVMPNVDGWDVLQRKSQDESIHDIPVVLVSAQDPCELPPTSQVFWASVGDGLSLSQLVECTLGFSRVILQPQGSFGPEPTQP